MFSLEEYMGTADLFFYVPNFGYFYRYVNDNIISFGCYVGKLHCGRIDNLILET